MSVTTGSTTGLESAFSGMRLQQPVRALPPKPAPANSKVQNLSVHVLSNAEQQQADVQIKRLIVAKQKVDDADAKIARGKSLEMQGKQETKDGKILKTEGKIQVEQAKDSLVVHQSQVVKGLEGMAEVLLKLKNASPTAGAKIEALRQKIFQLKDNLPQDTAVQQKRMIELKQESMVLMQSLKK